jgi:hypothetical protein
MQTDALPDAGSFSRLMQQAAELARRQMQPRPTSGEQPALLWRHAGNVAGRPRLPPLPQQRQHLRRQHDVAVLATLPLRDADDHLRAVDVAARSRTISPARSPQPAAVAERQHDVHLGVARHDEQPLGLLRAHHQRQLLRLLEVVDLGGEIVPPQRDAEQKPHPGHDPVAIADAQALLDQVQLEAAHVVGRRRIGRPAEECGEPLAAVDMASQRVSSQLVGGHILDDAPAQRADSIGTHGELLSEVDNASILRAHRPITDVLSIACRARRPGPAQRLSRQRFRALARRVI